MGRRSGDQDILVIYRDWFAYHRGRSWLPILLSWWYYTLYPLLRNWSSFWFCSYFPFQLSFYWLFLGIHLLSDLFWTSRPILDLFFWLQLVARLTKDIVEIYQLCNPQFRYSEELNLKRFLTSPSTGLLNDGCDNENSDLILTVNYSLVNSNINQRYAYLNVWAICLGIWGICAFLATLSITFWFWI